MELFGLGESKLKNCVLYTLYNLEKFTMKNA
jgi:hypothetical protein